VSLLPGIRIGSYAVHFYEFDLSEPAHVHMRCKQKEVKFWLTSVSLARNRGFTAHELREIAGSASGPFGTFH
jgi:hypothetical protein